MHTISWLPYLSLVTVQDLKCLSFLLLPTKRIWGRLAICTIGTYSVLSLNVEQAMSTHTHTMTRDIWKLALRDLYSSSNSSSTNPMLRWIGCKRMQEPNEAPTPVSYPQSPSPSMFPSTANIAPATVWYTCRGIYLYPQCWEHPPIAGTRRVILSSQGTTHERQIREFHYCSGSISILQSIDRSPTRRRRRCCCQPPTGRQPLSIPLWESRVWISSLATLGAQLRASYSLTVLSSPRVDAVSYILLAIKSLLLHYFCVAEGGEKVPSWGLLFCFGHEFSMRLSTCPPLFIPAEFDVWGFWSGVTTSHQYFFTLKIVGVFFFLVYLLLQIQQNG